MAATLRTNPLGRGFFTVREAARLIEFSDAHRIYGWLKGYPGRGVGPLLTRDYQPIEDHHELSFLDLIEIRFVEHFRHHQVKMRALRRAAELLRKEFGTGHPFATNRVHLVADKADVFLVVMKEAATETKDRVLLSLTTENYVIEEMIKRALVPGLVFDDATRLARKWHPRPQKFPEIVIDPLIAYGQPAGASGIPTATLYEAWQSEEEDDDAVAYWHDVKAQEVQQAVEFERLLDVQRQAVAA